MSIFAAENHGQTLTRWIIQRGREKKYADNTQGRMSKLSFLSLQQESPRQARTK